MVIVFVDEIDVGVVVVEVVVVVFDVGGDEYVGWVL